MNNQEKITTWSSKLHRSNVSSNVHRPNSQVISSNAVGFFFFEIKNIYSDTYLNYAGRWVINFFLPDQFPETRLFFSLALIQLLSSR